MSMISTPQLFKGLSVSALALASALTFTTAQAAEDSAMILEEIVVTAQKRSQNLQDVPSSVATLSGEKMDVLKAGGADIKFLSARVPSLYIESSFGRTFPRFYMRGLGNSDFDLNASQPVSLVYDDVVLENPLLKGFPVFDLERIEVLRGPQGTLFGRNTTAGIIKFESKKPTQETEGYVRASYGRFNAVELEAAAGGALVEDKLSARISGLYQRQDDYVDNTATDDESDLEEYVEVAARAQLLFTPTENFDALLNFHLRSLDGTARVFRANVIKKGTGGLIDGFDRDVVTQDGLNTQALDEYGFIAKMNYNLGNVTLTSVTSYEHLSSDSRADVDGGFGAAFLGNNEPGLIPFAGETQDAIPKLNQWTQEMRIASNDWDTVNFQVGMFYFNEDLYIESTNFDSLFGGDVNGFARQEQHAEAFAIFGNIDYDVTEDFVVTVGMRYSDDKKDFTAERTQTPVPFTGAADQLGPLSVSPSADVFSWDVSGTYTVDENINVYGRVAKSFRAPSIQGRVLFGDVVTIGDTETIHSFEMGVKSDLMENRARLNVSAFYYQIDDQQLTAVGGSTNFNQLINADKTVGYGFEADLEVLVADNLGMTFGVSYNDTEIQDPTLSIVPGAASSEAVLDAFGNVINTVSIDGNALPNSPKWIANFTARYAIPVANDGEFFIYTDWAYRSHVNFFLYNSEEFSSDNLLEGGLKAGYSGNNNQYEVSAYVRNITGNETLTGGIDFNNLTGFINPPRRWGIEAKYNF
ncbi:TonB-dependent receptor [Paremcibacter congregatus]|uniref:TonB-dependent receptor n=1 Tax=Paremcibacter congregatus TaxID=2043170 RepID=UPI0030EC454C